MSVPFRIKSKKHFTPKLLHAGNSKKCAKLEKLAKKKDEDEVWALADYNEAMDALDDLSAGFKLALKAVKKGCHAYLIRPYENDEIIVVGHAHEIHAALKKMGPRKEDRSDGGRDEY